jgi:hypothetical protein
MLDEKRIRKAESEGICFVCRMCERWYRGEDLGLKNALGDKACAANDGCGSPVGGKSFHEYKGPLEGYLFKHCFMCGTDTPEYRLKPKVFGAQKIGCCKGCLEVVKRRAVNRTDQRVILRSEKAAGPVEYEAEA